MIGSPAGDVQHRLLRRGRLLETATLSWNVVGVVVLTFAAIEPRSVALAGYGILATAVLIGLVLNALIGWWWADPMAGYVLLFYAVREAREAPAH